jgi:hypothetical protein
MKIATNMMEMRERCCSWSP